MGQPRTAGQMNAGRLQVAEDATRRVRILLTSHLIHPQLFLCGQRRGVQEFLSYTSTLICKSIEIILVKVNTAVNDLLSFFRKSG